MSIASNNVVSITRQKQVAMINKYAALHRELARIKSLLEMAKVEAIDLLGEGEHSTVNAKVTIKWVEREIFDQAKAKTFLTAGELAQCAKPSTFYDVRVREMP